MGNLSNREQYGCERFREALDALPAGGAEREVEEWRAALPEEAGLHMDACRECQVALEEFAETRRALAEFITPEPGPWFAKRVMALIGSREREEEARDGVWIYVRRLAPRMVVLSMLLLILGGGWAFQDRNREATSPNGKGGDMVFDSSVVPTWYDDGFSTLIEVRP
jgi:hypothetical protein